MERANRKLRFFDEKIGPIVLFVVGAARKVLRLGRRPPSPGEIKIVAIMKLAAIGDTVLVSGLLQDLRNWKPDVRILLYVGGSNAEYAKLLPAADEIIQLPISNPLKAIAKIRERKIDLLFNADSWPRLSALLAAFANAKWTVGFQTPGQNRHFADDELVPHLFEKHEIDNYRALLEARGIAAGSMPLKPRVNASQTNAKLVVLHMWPGGTKSHLKEWKPESWKELLIRLSKDSNLEFALSGSPGQKQQNQNWIQSLPSEIQSRVRNAAGLSLKDSIELLASARALVSVDTGVLHVGAALGIPVIGLHGPTHPKRWGGIGPKVYSVASRDFGAGRLHLGFDYQDDRNYLDSISVDEVSAQVQKALQVHYEL